MDARSQSIFASLLEVLVGAWAMLIPVFTSVTGGALTSVLITGGVVAFAGLVQLFWENVLPSWVDALAAVWLFISAYAFTVSTAATWNMALAAMAAFLLAVWDGVEVGQLLRAHQP